LNYRGQTHPLQLGDSTNVKQWQFRNAGGTNRFELVDAVDGEQFSITQAGVVNIANTLDIGVSPDNYSLPSARGALDQVLRTDGAGTVSWQSLPVQTLPTLQEVFDEGNAITTSLGNSSLLMQQGLTDTTDNMITVRDSGGTDNILIDSDGLILNERSHTKEVSIMDNSKIRRYDIKTDGGLANNLTIQATGGNLLQQTGLTGITGFYVDNDEKLRVNATGIDVQGSAATNQLVVKNSIANEEKWTLRTELANNNLELVNANADQTLKVLQSGEASFNVDNNEILAVEQSGMVVADNLKVSSFNSEIRENVPALPASLTWNARPSYAGIISFSASDTLASFPSNVEQRSVETLEYVILNKIDIGSIVSLEMSLNTVSNNDMMMGVQFTNGSEDYLNSLVGQFTSQYYVLVTKSGDTSKVFEAGAETVDAAPNINTVNGTYIVNLQRTALDSWEIFFEQNATVLTTGITLSGSEWGSRHAYFMVGDKSNVASSFNMAIQTCSSVGYNTAGDQELYTIRQVDNKLAIVDENGEDLIDIAANRIEIKQPLTAKNIDCGRMTATKINTTAAVGFQGMLPTATQLKLGLWDDTVDLVNTNVSGNNVVFPDQRLKRSIPSKEFFIPNDIQVGGYCEYQIQTVATNHFYSLGVLFKDPTNFYYGLDTFNSVNHWWGLFGPNGSGNLYYIRGQLAGNLDSFIINALPGTVIRVRITRTSETVWSQTYGVGNNFTTEPITFGVELSNKFCYATVCMFRQVTGSCQYNLVGFDYNLWNPSVNSYSLLQDSGNNLLVADNSGSSLIKINPNVTEIFQTVSTSRSLTINTNTFSNGAYVGGCFYHAVDGATVTGTTEIDMGTSTIGIFGGRTVPTLTVGNIIKMKASGLLQTGGDDRFLTVNVYWGDPNAGGILIGESDLSAKVKKDIIAPSRFWSMEISILPILIDFQQSEVRIQTYGCYSYNAKLDGKDSLEGVTIQNTRAGLVPLPYLSVPNTPTDVYVTGKWSDANALYSLKILSYSMNYEGFNL